MTKGKKIALAIFVVIPATCCLGGVLLFLNAGSSFARQLDDEKAKAKAIGMPVDVADLAQKKIPESQNAAPIYRWAHVRLNSDLEAASKTVAKGLGINVKPEVTEKADSALSDLKPLFSKLNELDQKPLCDFHYDFNKGLHLLFPEMADLKNIARLLIDRADYQDRQGDWRGALHSMSLANRVGVDATSTPFLIGLLVRVACRTMANREYEKIIGRHVNDNDFLEQVSTQLAKEATLPPERSCLATEIVFERIEIRQATSFRDLTGGEEQPSDAEKRAFSMKFLKDAVDANLIKTWRNGWVSLPKPDDDAVGVENSLSKMDQAAESDRSITGILSAIMLPVFSQAGDAVVNLQAHNHLLQTSVALLQARSEKGSLPKFLPKSLGDLAIDPFDGKHLRFRHEGRGFLLYSIGRDRVDDDGKRRDPSAPSNETYDEVVEFK